MTKSELLKYIDERLTQRSDGNIGLLMVRQYVSENMEDMPSAHPTQKNDSNTLEALDCIGRQAAIDEAKKLKPCPFCGSEDLYETYSQEYALGTKNPEIFCNSCKAIFSIEDDSPYMNCDEDYKYRKEKTKEAWNRRVNDRAEMKGEEGC